MCMLLSIGVMVATATCFSLHMSRGEMDFMGGWKDSVDTGPVETAERCSAHEVWRCGGGVIMYQCNICIEATWCSHQGVTSMGWQCGTLHTV